MIIHHRGRDNRKPSGESAFARRRGGFPTPSARSGEPRRPAVRSDPGPGHRASPGRCARSVRARDLRRRRP